MLGIVCGGRFGLFSSSYAPQLPRTLIREPNQSYPFAQSCNYSSTSEEVCYIYPTCVPILCRLRQLFPSHWNYRSSPQLRLPFRPLNHPLLWNGELFLSQESISLRMYHLFNPHSRPHSQAPLVLSHYLPKVSEDETLSADEIGNRIISHLTLPSSMQAGMKYEKGALKLLLSYGLSFKVIPETDRDKYLFDSVTSKEYLDRKRIVMTPKKVLVDYGSPNMAKGDWCLGSFSYLRAACRSPSILCSRSCNYVIIEAPGWLILLPYCELTPRERCFHSKSCWWFRETSWLGNWGDEGSKSCLLEKSHGWKRYRGKSFLSFLIISGTWKPIPVCKRLVNTLCVCEGTKARIWNTLICRKSRLRILIFL